MLHVRKLKQQINGMIVNETKHQAPVVQRADNSIQRITHYPIDKMYQFQYILSTGLRVIRWIELSAL